jgi:hypothetical protein
MKDLFEAGMSGASMEDFDGSGNGMQSIGIFEN